MGKSRCYISIKIDISPEGIPGKQERKIGMKVLVVIDMKNDFLTGVLGNEECANTISQVVDVVRNGNYDHIFLTRDTHSENYMETQEGKKLPVPHCIKNTEGWEINADVMAAVKEKYDGQYTIVDKPTFGSADLATKLKGICENTYDTEIEFVGVCTGICVISNVLLAKANLYEAQVKVIEKACACVTPDTHRTAIDAMKTCQIDIV